MSSLQQRIQDLMTQKNMGATDIERKTGLNRNTIYGIVAGNSKNPSAYNLQLIAKALDVSLESMLVDEEEIKLDILNHAQMKAFCEATSSTINIIIEKNLNFSLDKLISLIKEVYQYSIKIDPPTIDDRFIHWMIDKHTKS
jgi:transcriptional regulator with XRE-family HTH domain